MTRIKIGRDTPPWGPGFVRVTAVPTFPPRTMIIALALGFIVGTAIAGQTFYNFTLDNLRSMSFSNRVYAAELCDRVVAVLDEHAVVQLLGPRRSRARQSSLGLDVLRERASALLS